MDDLLHGAVIGSMVAFIAFGYALIYSVLRFINFAHGEVIMVGGYLAYAYHRLAGLPFGLSVLLAVVSCGLLGVLLERLAFKPLRQGDRLSLLLSSLALSLILQAAISLIFGSTPRLIIDDDPIVSVLGRPFYIREIVAVALLPLLASGLSLLLRRTKAGLAIRAIASAPLRARHLMLPIDGTISLAFFLASALAGTAGILLGIETGLTPSMGFRFSLWGFAVAVIAGLGSLRGVLLGGVLYGMLMNYAIAYGSGLFADALSLGAVAVVLLLRGSGLAREILRRF